MKTKAFLLICLLLGMALNQVSAQTRAYPFRFSSDWALGGPVYCNGAEIDRIVLDFWTCHGEFLVKDGIFIRSNSKISGQCHSLWTQEIFTYKEEDKSVAGETTYDANFNLIGNQGHHYIQTFVIEVADQEFILHPLVIKSICVNNGPNK